ncbi:9787_t:CDS:2 [Ambispora leptoticha]|uniref:9787_t:CDS:1 n=1 Tax=Ambispora leptoticha TaxID=144679 RepID=A0A9N8ZHP9_9GLOM|nr:9787_t:CDS:2 [Ambispora leptoticha]
MTPRGSPENTTKHISHLSPVTEPSNEDIWVYNSHYSPKNSFIYLFSNTSGNNKEYKPHWIYPFCFPLSDDLPALMELTEQ